MKGVKIYFILIFITTTLTASYHPVHVSVLNVDYSTSKKSMVLSLKLFKADIELAVAHNYNIALYLGLKNENPQLADQYISKYLSTTLQLTVNNNVPVKIGEIQRTINEDAIWLNINIPVNQTIKELKIHNAALMDIYFDQTNLVIVSVNKKEKGFRLNFYHREILLTYDGNDMKEKI